MASIDLYTKQQIDAKIPDTSGASAGDVLTFNGSSNEWSPAGGSGGVTAHTYTTLGELATDMIAHPTAICVAQVQYANPSDDAYEVPYILENIAISASQVNLTGSTIKYNAGAITFTVLTVGNIATSSTATSHNVYHRFREIASGAGGAATGWTNVSSNQATIDVNHLVLYY